MVTEVTFSQPVTTREQLREIIAEPNELAVRKQICVSDEHCRAFIERSPFLFLATSDAQGNCDVSPKGDAAGFVQSPVGAAADHAALPSFRMISK